MGLRPLECSSFDFFSFLLFQNFIDGLVENRAVTMDINALCVRLPSYHIKPAHAIRVFVYYRDSLLQKGVAAGKVSFGDTKQVRNCLEPLNPADDLAWLHSCARLGFKSMVHHVAQHPDGELGETDAPQLALLPRNPAMGWTVKVIRRQLGH